MQLSGKVLGVTAVAQLTKTRQEHVLVVGKDRFTRSDLAGIDCFNFVAARNLTAAMHVLQVKNLQDVFDNVPPMAMAMPHVGTISLAVLGAAFEAKKIGGSNPLESWVKKHLDGNTRTFGSIKTKVHKLEHPEEKQNKKRRHNR